MMKEIKQEDIALEAALLNTLANKKNYEQFIDALEVKRLIPTTANLLKDYKKYFEKHNNDIDWSIFYPEFCEWHRKDLDEHDLAYYRDTVFPLIRDSISDTIYCSLLEREATNKIETILRSGYDHTQIENVLKELKDKKALFVNEKEEDVFTLGSVDCSVLDASKGLTWCLPALQAGLGSHMPGQFVLISADSNAGKSALCISQAAHVFEQLQKIQQCGPILYCTSEDTEADLVCRFLSNLYKNHIAGGFEEIVKNYDKVCEDYKKKYTDGLFIGMQIRSHKDLYKISSKIDKYKPSLVIIDMLDALSEGLDINSLTKTYQYIRALANSGYPIIGTTQAGNTSYQDSETKEYKHRKWLTEKDTQGSKGGGKQGAAYCMIMIGIDDDMPNIRYLQTTKKKRGRHVQVTCQLDDIYSNYKELL